MKRIHTKITSGAWPETRSEGWPLGRCRASQTTSRHPAASHSPWEANSWNFQQNWSEIGEFGLLCTSSHCVNLQCCQYQEDCQVDLDDHVNVVLGEEDDNLAERKYLKLSSMISIQSRLITRNNEVGRNWVRKVPLKGFCRRNSTTSPVKFRISAVQWLTPTTV